jgi:hypothetical protein
MFAWDQLYTARYAGWPAGHGLGTDVESGRRRSLDKRNTPHPCYAGFHLFLNFDVKKIWMRTSASADGVALGSLKIDPLVVGIGAGMRF